MTERETLLAEIAALETANKLVPGFVTLEGALAQRQARIAELDAPDPLLIEAIDLVVNDDVTRTATQNAAIREGRAGKEKVNLALAALRRGMELAEAPPMGSVMTDAEIWTLACELSESCSGGKTREQFVDAVIRETLSRVQPRWPSEGELRDMAMRIAQEGHIEVNYYVRDAALEMARRIRAYQTGEQP